jgi:hypothetical protein
MAGLARYWGAKGFPSRLFLFRELWSTERYTLAVTIREFFLENFAGDLEYHPRRGLLYLGLAIAAECLWIFSSYEERFTAIRLVFLSGGLGFW